MGSGASLLDSSESLLTTALIFGHALSQMYNPGIYRIQDFHSSKAPPLKSPNPFVFSIQSPFSYEDDDEENPQKQLLLKQREDDEDKDKYDESVYKEFFSVDYQDNTIYIEDPCEPNQDNWTPLHTCCMNKSTVPIGLKLIEETVKRGDSLEIKTKVGPSNYNSGWTPLFMACAYGIDELVEKLIENGANVNATNSYGTSCLIEATQRGFYNIVSLLIKNGADLDYIPPHNLAVKSPFFNAPIQTALGYAARSGYTNILELLIQNKCDINMTNNLGWTALHEACFYHRYECVKLLLKNNADATIRTNQGALAYHLSGLSDIKELIRELGGKNACPNEDNDKIDMLKVLTELTIYDAESESSFENNPNSFFLMFESPGSNPFDDDVNLQMENIHLDSSDISNSYNNVSSGVVNDYYNSSNKYPSKDDSNESKSSMLRDLPDISSPKKKGINIEKALETIRSSGNPLKKKIDLVDPNNPKKKKKKLKNQNKDIPSHFLCELSNKIMKEPVKTKYGNYFDHDTLKEWFQSQGKICPITFMPLSEIDYDVDNELMREIKSWKKNNNSESPKKEQPRDDKPRDKPVEEEDIYNF